MDNSRRDPLQGADQTPTAARLRRNSRFFLVASKRAWAVRSTPLRVVILLRGRPNTNRAASPQQPVFPRRRQASLGRQEYSASRRDPLKGATKHQPPCGFAAPAGFSSSPPSELGRRIKKPPAAMLRRLVFVGVAGFEPATSCSQSRRDNRATLHPEEGGKNNQKCMRIPLDPLSWLRLFFSCSQASLGRGLPDLRSGIPRVDAVHRPWIHSRGPGFSFPAPKPAWAGKQKTLTA